MKRRMLLGSMALAALPGLARTRQPKALLTVSGRIGRVNNEATDTFDFSEADFLKLASTTITTSRPVGKIRVKTCHIPKPYVGSVVRVGIASGFRSVGYSPNRLSLLVAYGLRNAKSDGRMSIPLDFST